MRQICEKIRKQMVAAIADYEMLKDGDRVMVAVSGGKDSSLMLLLLKEIQQKAPFNFSLQPVLLDQKQPGFQPEAFKRWVRDQVDLELIILEEDTYSIVKDKVTVGKSFCGLCSRLRRGILYNYAHDQGYTKIALGHHREDLNETLLLNLFFNGRLSSMPPKLKSDDERNIVIRPLVYTPEEWLIQAAKELDFPILPCNLCGSQENLQRARIKEILSEFTKDYPEINASMLKAQQNIRKSQLLDREFWSFDF